MIIRLHKEKPWYKAGQRFGWKGAGLGIDIRVFENKFENILQFNIKTAKSPYYIYLGEAYKIVQKYNSWYETKTGIVGVIPFSEVKSNLGITNG